MNAAISGFEILVGDRRIQGSLHRKDEAAAIFDDAVSSGQGAYLLEQQTNEVFRISVGNLAPQMEATVVIRYVAEMRAEGDGVRFVLPTTIAPRYTPSQSAASAPSSGGVPVSETSDLNYKLAGKVCVAVLHCRPERTRDGLRRLSSTWRARCWRPSRPHTR